MAITEQSRYQLDKRLEEMLGADDANTLMEHLPHVGWSDVAANTDIDHLHAATRADLAEVRAEIAQLRTETRADFALVRSDMRQVEERLTMHVDKALAVGLHRQFVQLIASTAAMFAIWSTIIVLIGR